MDNTIADLQLPTRLNKERGSDDLGSAPNIDHR